jgi:hypothetical protein
MPRPVRFQSGIAHVCLSTGGFALSVPGLSIVLNRRGAQDIVAALTFALLATVPAEPPATKPKRR